MNEMNQQLSDVLAQVAVPDEALNAARARRDAVRREAQKFTGVRDTFRSGSVATGVVTHPLEDSDSGMILDRRCYPTLGPDGEGDPPTDVVADLHSHLGPLIREVWPSATIHDMKRGVTVRFHEPLADGTDPYVDLVLALDRKDAPGLWIPNLDNDTWDASHPQKHVELMNAGARSLRVVRARVVRLAKTWNKQFASPALSSFNLVALALETIEETTDLATALTKFFEHAHSSLSISRTEDPAAVSGPIKYEGTRDQVLSRLRSARDHLQVALADPGDLDVVVAELYGVFWNYLPEPIDLRSSTSAQVTETLRSSNPRFRETAAGLTVLAGAVKTQRAYGGPRRG